MAIYAPLGLLSMAASWLVLAGTGFALVYWGLGDSPVSAMVVSGSSLFTLGYARPASGAGLPVSFLEAAVGLVLIALLIAYLPPIYAAFSRRETAVALLEVIAGTPPSAVVLLQRHARVDGLSRLPTLWMRWQEWFPDVEESHTSIAALVFFRSPLHDRSWVTAAGCILDAAALAESCLDVPPSPDAALCIRGGFVCLHRVAEYFNIPHPHNPRPDDPISVSREEFDAAWDALAASDAPMKPDRDAAWVSFAGWRVNYDAPLLGLAALTMAPSAPWSSDRAGTLRRPPLIRSLVGRTPTHSDPQSR